MHEMDVDPNLEEQEQEQEYSRHMLYILYNDTNKACYNGYTVDFNKRIRQHNCELAGGAKLTSKLVKSKGVVWKPLALIRVPLIKVPGFDQRRALQTEWSIKYPDNHRPRPAKFNGAVGRLQGLGLVFDNPKFAELSFHVQVFTKMHYDVLTSVLTETCRDRVEINLMI